MYLSPTGIAAWQHEYAFVVDVNVSRVMRHAVVVHGYRMLHVACWLARCVVCCLVWAGQCIHAALWMVLIGMSDASALMI